MTVARCLSRWATGLTLGGATLLLGATSASAAEAITVTPSTNLHDGSVVTVSFSGFAAGSSVVVGQCTKATFAVGDCDVARVLTVQADSTGSGSTPYTVHTGAIGTGTCNAGSTCYLAAVVPSPVEVAVKAIRFKPSSPSTPPTTAAPSASPSSPSAGGGTVPTVIQAGTGGTADRAPSSLPIVLGGTAGSALLAAGALLARRRRQAGAA
jgi:hypothetical protein